MGKKLTPHKCPKIQKNSKFVVMLNAMKLTLNDHCFAPRQIKQEIMIDHVY